jgi:epoxyqueuosine reductase
MAGLGWVGKNGCLISPKSGSFFFLAELFVDLPIEADPPIQPDYCGICSRCIEACPTACILPDRTIDSNRCIAYHTIENKGSIPLELRRSFGNLVFGCDICQTVCPWNRFAAKDGDPAFNPRDNLPQPDLIRELELSPKDFNRKFKDSPIQRAKRRGYLRNVAVALGNKGYAKAIPALEEGLNDAEPLVRGHASWARDRIKQLNGQNE